MQIPSTLTFKQTFVKLLSLYSKMLNIYLYFSSNCSSPVGYFLRHTDKILSCTVSRSGDDATGDQVQMLVQLGQLTRLATLVSYYILVLYYTTRYILLIFVFVLVCPSVVIFLVGVLRRRTHVFIEIVDFLKNF